MDALTLSVAAAAISSIAALVSAVTALLAFRHQRRTTSPSVEVSASIARVFFAGATDWGHEQIAIEVVNTGLFAVDVRSVGVIGTDGQEGVLMSHKDLWRKLNDWTSSDLRARSSRPAVTRLGGCGPRFDTYKPDHA